MNKSEVLETFEVDLDNPVVIDIINKLEALKTAQIKRQIYGVGFMNKVKRKKARERMDKEIKKLAKEVAEALVKYESNSTGE